MTLYKQKQDLFQLDKTYSLVFTINKDMDFSHSTPKIFKSTFPSIDKSFNKRRTAIGQVVQYTHSNQHVFGCVTTAHHWERPIKSSLKYSFEALRRACLLNNVERIALTPDSLGVTNSQVNQTLKVLEDVFENTSIDILICL